MQRNVRALVKSLPKPITPPSKRTSVFERTMLRAIRGAADHAALDHLYLARAGEAFVAAKLLRRGLNAGTAPVDSGVDILAHRELRLKEPLLHAEHLVYQFQVKTTARDEYQASLPVRKVHELWHKVINLIVVFWSDRRSPA